VEVFLTSALDLGLLVGGNSQLTL